MKGYRHVLTTHVRDQCHYRNDREGHAQVAALSLCCVKRRTRLCMPLLTISACLHDLMMAVHKLVNCADAVGFAVTLHSCDSLQKLIQDRFGGCLCCTAPPGAQHAWYIHNILISRLCQNLQQEEWLRGVPASLCTKSKDMPEIIAAEDWLWGVKHPASSRSAFRVIDSIDNGNMLRQASQHQRQYSSMAPRAGVPNIEHISASLCLHMV